VPAAVPPLPALPFYRGNRRSPPEQIYNRKFNLDAQSDKPDLIASSDKPDLIASSDKPDLIASSDKPDLIASSAKPNTALVQDVQFDKPEQYLESA
jgi:hypothetical protein